MGLFGRETQKTKSRPVPPQGTPSTAPILGATTTVAEGTKIVGDIGGSSDLRIEGDFEGSISVTGIAFVSGSGCARAAIRAASVAVAGKVDGDIAADEMIELQSTAVVNGNLLAPKILIREGASLQGRVEMASPPDSKSGKQESSGKGKAEKRRSRATQEQQPPENSSPQGKNGKIE